MNKITKKIKKISFPVKIEFEFNFELDSNSLARQNADCDKKFKNLVEFAAYWKKILKDDPKFTLGEAAEIRELKEIKISFGNYDLK